MVALKPATPTLVWRGEVTKQERRGGIETYAGDFLFIAANTEAGTPWWH